MLGVLTYRNGQIVTASQLGDLARVTERGTHDDGVVAVLLVVVVDALHGLDTGVLLRGVVPLVGGLVPIEDTADEGRDEVGAGLGTGDGLDEGEHEGQVAVDAVLGLQDVGSLDALPGGGDLDEDALLGDADLLVEFDDVQGLVDRGLGVEGEAGVDLGGDLAGDDLQDLLAELDEKVIQGGVDLFVEGFALDFVSMMGNDGALKIETYLLLALLDGGVDQAGIFGLLGRGQDEGGVGGGILGLVLADGGKVTRVADDDLSQLGLAFFLWKF